MKKRIWELDAFRGLCILGMVLVHLVFDITVLYPLVNWQYPAWFQVIMNGGGYLFVLLSGCCATLGRHHVSRGLIVFGCGMLCTLATWLMVLGGFYDDGLMIRFGVLHCLGCCMLLWALLSHAPRWVSPLIGLASLVLGAWARTKVVLSPWLAILGFQCHSFSSGDYFPLLTNLGIFLIGAWCGYLFYSQKTTLLPMVNDRNPILRFLQFCGRHSLIIYLLHQPVLAGISALIYMISRGYFP